MDLPALYDRLPLEEGQIRVLSIDKGTDSALSTRLTVHTIKRDSGISGWLRGSLRDFWSPYEALSYCWGDPKPNRPIRCNGEITHIHANLYDAFLALRYTRPGVPIWTDALCINQSDKAERTNQIAMMGEIYSAARQVWAFIGEPPSGMEALVPWIPKICRAWKKIEPRGQSEHPENWHNTPQGLHSDPSLPLYNSPIWRTLVQLLNKEYFDRLWILQEVALAKRVIILCGTYKLSWTHMEQLFEAADRLQAVQQYRPPGLLYNRSAFLTANLVWPNGWGWLGRIFLRNARVLIAYMVHWLERNQDQITMAGLPEMVLDVYRSFVSSDLESLLQHSRRQRVSHPKDRILAITGMLQVLTGQQELPWLSRTLSPEDIYLEAFYFLAHKDMSFTLLQMAPPSPESTLSLPSWCPDFHHHDETLALGGEQGFSGRVAHSWQASKRNQRVWRGSDSRTLRLAGVRVSDIYFVSEPWRTLYADPLDSAERQIRIAANHIWLNAAVSTVLELHSAQDEAEAPEAMTKLWDTIMLERTATLGAEALNVNDFRRLREFLERATSSTSNYEQEYERARVGDQEPDSSQRPRVLDTLKRLDFELREKTFLLTEHGQFGLAYPGARAGDTLVVFQGAKVPHLLRRQQQSNNFTFVGEAYIHGLMNGSAEEAMDGRSPEPEIFALV